MNEELLSPITTGEEASRLLADFLVWIEHPLFKSDDQADYLYTGLEFLLKRGYVVIEPAPRHTVAWCDLCGRSFTASPTWKAEVMTGNNFIWCPSCFDHQWHQFAILGPAAYRESWERDGAANG